MTETGYFRPDPVMFYSVAESQDSDSGRERVERKIKRGLKHGLAGFWAWPI